nr:metal-sensitive transcriptional regulator [Paenibacillus ginsengarvi]
MSVDMEMLEHVSEHDSGCCSPDGSDRKSHHSDKVKNSLVSRLNRIEGQIRGIKGLIDKDTYCDDVLNQIASVQSALNGVGKLLLEHHLKSCIIERIQEGDTEVLTELMTTMNKLIK